MKKCKTHPLAPHGFCRSSSLSEGDYVCECDSWEEPFKYVRLEGKGFLVMQEKDDEHITFVNNSYGTVNKTLHDWDDFLELFDEVF